MEYLAITMNEYKRKDHFNHFRSMINPFISLTVQIDITNFIKIIKEGNYPFFLSFLYIVTNSANQIPELKQRIRETEIIEYNMCLSSYTVIKDDNTYRYCLVDTNKPFKDFVPYAKYKQNLAVLSDNLIEEETTDNLFYISTLPWLSYSQLNLPYSNSDFSIPNISWGKYYYQNDKILIPVTLMVNHALVDGYHLSQFFSLLQDSLNNKNALTESTMR